MKKFPVYAVFALSIALVSFSSCVPRGESPSNLVLSGDGAQSKTPEKPRFRRPSGGPAVLLAMGESWAARPEILADLAAEYGRSADGGSLRVMRYPEDFKVEGRVRLSALAAEASDSRVSTVLALGCPEGTFRELLRIRNTRPGIRIASLLPEDDPLSAESSSDFVVDQFADKAILADETGSGLSDSDISFLLLAAALASEKLDAGANPVPILSESLLAARKASGKKKYALSWRFEPWIDSDSGLRSFNHAVLDMRIADAAGGAAPVSGGTAPDEAPEEALPGGGLDE